MPDYRNRSKCSGLIFWKKRRYIVTLLTFLGYFIFMSIRVNLSVAIVEMTKQNVIIDGNGNKTYEQEFNWDPKLQGYVLSAFFYGYITSQIPGGWLISRVGSKRVFGFGIAFTSFFNTIIPPMAKCSVYLLIFTRVILGIASGFVYPSMNAVMANWSPLPERSKLITFVISGCFMGTVISTPTFSVCAERLGWPSIFYISGIAGLLWSLCWFFMVSDKPEDDPYISISELNYIKDKIGIPEYQQNEKILIPWRAMMTSPVLWAIIFVQTCENWGFYTMVTQLPTFFHDALNMSLEEAGLLAGIPYLGTFTILVVSGNFANFLNSRNILTTTRIRQTFVCTAFICQSFLLVLTVVLFTPTVAVICISLTLSLSGLAWAAMSVNYVEIAPQFAGVTTGIGNTIGTLPGIISPIVTGYIVSRENSDEWKTVFLICGGFYFFGALIYGIFASGELQSWARQKKMINRYSSRNDL